MGAPTIDREEDVAVVTFDLPGESVNKCAARVIEEFKATFERLGSDTAVSAIVVLSCKRDIFIAGAEELSALCRLVLSVAGPTLRRVTPCGGTSIRIAQRSIHEPAVGSRHGRWCP